MKSLFEKHIENDRLKNIDDSEVLLTLGQNQFPPALPALLHYALESEDYYTQMNAVQGLIDWDLSSYQERIAKKLEAVNKDPYFSEWLPGLLPHTSPTQAKLEEYYEIGRFISNDRSAGILFGMALSQGGKDLFIRALSDPEWEIDDLGVGLHHTARYCALRLGVSINFEAE